MAPTVIGATIILVHDVHTDEDWFYAAGGEHNVPNGVINNNIAME
ncbi:6030_t:CDS:1, partial [Rhizophagus irregularis]